MAQRILITGGSGLLGHALRSRFARDGHHAILTPSRAEMDLLDAAAVSEWFRSKRPEGVIHAAGVIGGLQAHLDRPAEFLEDNLRMTLNVMAAAREVGVARLMLVASSAIYPAAIDGPITESNLLQGPLDEAHTPYSIAKIAGIVLGEAYRSQHGMNVVSVVPCALYGPLQPRDPARAQVIPALIQRFVRAVREGADTVELWGSGTATREFLHVRDAADACHVVYHVEELVGLINVGSGQDTAISEVARLIALEAGFAGRIMWNAARPEGVKRRVLDVSRLLSTGWRPRIALHEGIAEAVAKARSD